jgi:hypothetical protein
LSAYARDDGRDGRLSITVPRTIEMTTEDLASALDAV